METRIAKKSRFQIVKLEERVAPGALVALAAAQADATAVGNHVALTGTQVQVSTFTGHHIAISTSESVAAAASA